MASALLKLIVLSVCLNTFLYLGVNYALSTNLENRPEMQDDLFSILLEDADGTKDALDEYVRNLNNTENATFSYKFDLSGNFSNPPEEKTGIAVIPRETGLNFLDSLRMVKAFLVTLWRIATMPIALFSYNILPPLVAVIIGFPLLILNITTIIVLFRGGGAV